MYRGKKILAIIPARGGSKSIPHKNMVLLNQRPLLFYSIQQAAKSKYIDKFIVSSDSDKILTAAKKYGSGIIKRPSHLARDNSKMDEAIRHALLYLQKSVGYAPDFIVLLQPTSPLRKVSTIDKAIAIFINNADKLDSLVPVCELEPKIGHIKKGRYYPLNATNMQRQELEPIYKECGTVFLFKPERILKKQALYGTRILPFIIGNRAESLDINNREDIKLANYFLNI